MMQQEMLLKAYRLMCTAAAMARLYDENRTICKYVHSTSRGHEAIQLAAAFQLLPIDYVSPYYRDDSILLGIGYEPYALMLQLLAKADDPFSGGRSYYSHPSNRQPDKPNIIHQSSATGMQVIPATGIAQGIKYLEGIQSDKLKRGPANESPVVICSLGDGSVTEGEVSEAFQFSVLKKLPVIYLVQDNNWGISASSKETRVMDAYEYTSGFAGMHRVKVDGSDFVESYDVLQEVVNKVRYHREPFLVHASVPLLGHHTSGVRREFYRTEEELQTQSSNDPIIRLRKRILEQQVPETELLEIEKDVLQHVEDDFSRAVAASEPDPAQVSEHIFAPTPVKQEQGTRSPVGANKILMVDAALFAIREIMEDNPEAILFGQDVGKRLGGVFREAATLADLFGDHRVFNTAIQEAYIIGSTAGLSAVGVKPMVEVQFADYLYPGLNQLVCEIAKSNYLTNGKYPVQTLIRVPVGSYGGGGPYHSGCIETTLLSIKGLKIVYPSNAADMKGLLKAAFYDPNPVIMLEHKGLYWGKVPGTEDAKTPEPSKDYIIPLGKGKLVIEATEEHIRSGDSCCIITYGMGVYWAKAAAVSFPGQVEIVDLRTLYPLDEEMIYTSVKKHGRCLVLTEEQQENSFAEALAGRIANHCFHYLDAPMQVLGALNLPAVPINTGLEKAMLPNPAKVVEVLRTLIAY